jgi:hypothetical protein
MNQSTKIAANTNLPPAPSSLESLNSSTEPVDLSPRRPLYNDRSRLRSIAKYTAFQPQALACSSPIASSYADSAASPVQKHSQAFDHFSAVSLGAVAGPHGIALFRVTRPHCPLLILSHASNSSTEGNGGSVSSLTFASSSLYLAAARGSSALVYDISGHSLSPLWGRVGVDNHASTKNTIDTKITSLAWQPSPAPWLAATTASTVCLWDLREQSRSASFKPSLRFGVARNSATGSSAPPPPNVQVACSDKGECAVLDASGRLRVFDTRMTDRRGATSPLCAVLAFSYAGIGLAYMPNSSENASTWATWGLDNPLSDAIVRIWTAGDTALEHNIATCDDYWYMDGGITSSATDAMSLHSQTLGCKLIGQCRSRNLACARVCPSPIEDSILTVGLDLTGSEQKGWKADLWKVPKPCNKADVVKDQELQHVMSFRDETEAATRAIGKDFQFGSLCGAELALTSEEISSNSQEKKGGTADRGLLLCCLTNGGCITTYVRVS